LNNSKLVNVLRTLTKSEMKEFEKFISSPYYNRGRNYIPFFSQLKKFHPRFDDEKMTPEYIYAKMHPAKKFNKQIIWNLSSHMLNMAEEFLLLAALKRNRFIKDYQIADEYSERKLPAYFLKKLGEMDKLLDKMGLDDNYFRYKTRLESAMMLYHFHEDTQHLLPEHILKKGEYSVLNFMREISDILGSLRISKSMYNKEFDTNIPLEFTRNIQLKNIVDYANDKKFRYAPVLEMYYLSVMLSLEFDNTDHFFRLKELFEKHYRLYSKEEKFLWSAELSNYSVQKINQGKLEFRQKIIELDKFRLKEGILFTTKYIPKVTFMQIFGNALYANEIEWAEKLIEEYAPLLKPSLQKQVRDLCYAFIQYRLKNYSAVPAMLSKLNLTDALDKIYVKSLYLRIYYELKDINLMLYNLDSARYFFNTNKSVPANLKGNYIKFLSCFTRLIDLRDNYDDFEADKLMKTVTEDKSIALSEWIIEKLDELKKEAG
jgi:hypothetical protein